MTARVRAARTRRAARHDVDDVEALGLEPREERRQHVGGLPLDAVEQDDAAPRGSEPTYRRLELGVRRHRDSIRGAQVRAEHRDAARLPAVARRRGLAEARMAEDGHARPDRPSRTAALSSARMPCSMSSMPASAPMSRSISDGWSRVWWATVLPWAISRRTRSGRACAFLPTRKNLARTHCAAASPDIVGPSIG